MNTTINPFYTIRKQWPKATAQSENDAPVFVKLPRAPRNASPVPHLTSLYHFDGTGRYGDRSYPGNCDGGLIKDLLTFFKPALIADPMTGGGTCSDVCEDLGIPCMSWDIHSGFDACDTAGFGAETFNLIWVHPPYWRQKLYTADARDLSRARTLDDFLRRYGQFVRNCAKALKPDGKLAVLMGDYIDRDNGFIPLTYHTKRLAFAAGLSQCCTDIIRFSHGASSSKNVYRSSFIPGLHDVCMVFAKSASEE